MTRFQSTRQYKEKDMSWTVQLKFTRPNTGVDWYVVTNVDKDEKTQDWLDTGKIISMDRVMAGDELSHTITTVFKDEAAKNEYKAYDTGKPSWVSARNTYNATNSITKEVLQDEAT